MKVLFLDIDGVVNSEETLKRTGSGGMLGIDPYLAFIVGKITLAIPELKVVLSSSWRHFPNGRTQVEEKVCPIYDQTLDLRRYCPEDMSPFLWRLRGREIQMWIEKNGPVEKYAILDDDSDMLDEQFPHFFRTTWKKGITEEIAQSVVLHLKD